MGGYGAQILLVVALILINAIFAGSEMALVSLRESQLQRLEQQGGRGRTLAGLARDPNRFLATIQIGITLAGALASASAAVSLSAPVAELLTFLGGAARAVAIVLVTLILTFAQLVFGELAPKRIAMQRAEQWALLVARPLDMIARISRPAVWLLSKTSDLVVRMFGGDPDVNREEITEQELRDLVNAQRGFTAEQRTIITGAFEITERTLRQILVPRRDVVDIPAGTAVAEALAVLVAAGHSRAPVTASGDLDDVVGIVHLRDLLGDSGTAADQARPALLLPESLHVADALRRMRVEREQFALVVDERGSIDGIVTIEDLVEEIVGEIYDETDRDVAGVSREPDGSLLVPGTFPIHDLGDIGVHLKRQPDGDYTTIAGLILSELGRIPERPGDTVKVDGWSAEITEVDGRAITGVRLRPARQPARPT